jgi:HPt (histidine-containing phosphotransfer) domain-containing protein
MDLDQQLAKLRDEYVASFPLKREAFEAWAHRITFEESELPRLDELKTLAHRLAGSAGTHGFDELAAAATRLESVILSADPDTLDRPAFREALVERIADVCGRLGCDQDPG